MECIVAWINDNTKPVIFLGSNSAIWHLLDICAKCNIKVAGIIDNDYFSNTEVLDGLPVIDTEKSFEDSNKLKYYKENYNFFLIINVTGQKTPVHIRNSEKRQYFIDQIEKYELNCISIIDPSAIVHPTNKIGKNVLIDAFVYISAFNQIGDFSHIYAYTAIGHHNIIGKNCFIQRQAGIHVYNVLEDNVYVGLSSQVFAEGACLKQGTVIHPCLAVNRSTKENEVVSLAGRDLRRIYPYIQEG